MPVKIGLIFSKKMMQFLLYVESVSQEKEPPTLQQYMRKYVLNSTQFVKTINNLKKFNYCKYLTFVKYREIITLMKKKPYKMKLKRGKFLEFLKSIARLFKKKPEIINLSGEELKDKAIYLSNHAGAHGPIT